MPFTPDPGLHDGGIPLGGSMTGRVRWFKNEKGYGRITGDDGYVYWFHYSVIEVDGYKTLEEGRKVTFQWHGGRADHGRRPSYTCARCESARLGQRSGAGTA